MAQEVPEVRRFKPLVRDRQDLEQVLGRHKQDFDSANMFNAWCSAARDYQLSGTVAPVWGDWLGKLDEMADWNWYATLTFRGEWVHPETADKAYMRWLHRINRKVFGVRYTARGQGVRWARALEWQKRGVIHFHAIVADVEGQDVFYWMDEWYGMAGIARIYPYDRRLGARYYLGKYLIKGGEVDIGGDWSSVAKQRLLPLDE